MKSFIMKSPIGDLQIIANDVAIVGVKFEDELDATIINSNTNVISQAIFELNEYFLLKRKTFFVPISLKGTRYQLRCWDIMKGIEYGETCTYSDISNIMKPNSSPRAVGNACNKNPIPIIVPCHRVVGKNGNLTGYRGQLWRKKLLLDIENTNKLI